MAITPDTNLYLLKCPLEIDNKNQITFTNELAQRNYFLSLPYLENDHFSYQRRDSVIRYPAHIDSIMEYNYCMYQNNNYTNKWFYAFITGMQYLNDNCTLISIATDVFQTWQFNLQYKECFIEREHINVNEDGIGANLLPEGLEFGEVIENASTSIKGLGICYVIAFAKDPYQSGLIIGPSPWSYNGTIVNGVASGLWYYVANKTRVLDMLKQIDTLGLGESVITVFSVPSIAYCINQDAIDNYDNPDFEFGAWLGSSGHATGGRTFSLNSVPTTLDGYTPRNNKLRQYPYTYLGFTPSNGTPQIFRYEDFQNATPQFHLISEVNPNPSVYFIPKNYKGITGDNVSEAVTVGGYPSISYHTDHYSNWIAQNQNLLNLNMSQNEFTYNVNQAKTELSAVQNATNLATNALTLNATGAVNSGIGLANNYIDYEANKFNHDQAIKTQMAQIEQHTLLPNSGSTGGSNATLIGYGLFNQDIFTRYTIKRQFAERLDKYFDMYGYLTNKVKVPNINGRPTWNYVKTLGAIIEGNVPQADLDIIKNLFNNGITLWHSTENFLNYSANNR